MLTIKRTGSDDYGKETKVLICGQPGVGKTLISSTWPNPIYASAEGGLMSIADRNIPYVEIRRSDDLLRLKNALDQDPNVREEMLGFPVETVVIDTIDEVQRILIRERLESQKKEILQMQDWGWLNEQMQAIVRSFRNLSMNTIFTCHLKETVDAESGRVFYRPSLAGAIGDNIPAYVDLALLLEVSTVSKVTEDTVQKMQVRHLISVPDHNHTWIKDRSGKLPERLEVNFTDDYKNIYELIFSNLDLPATQELEIDDSSVETSLVKEELEKPASPQARTRAAVPPESSAKAPRAGARGKVEEVGAASDKVPQNAPQREKKGPRNSLPEGVVPHKGEHNTDIYCTECGNEVESEDQAELSRIRFRSILCRACFVNRKK